MNKSINYQYSKRNKDSNFHLDWNEATKSPFTVEEIAKLISEKEKVNLNLYPIYYPESLRKEVKNFYSIDSAYSLHTSGSDAALEITLAALRANFSRCITRKFSYGHFSVFANNLGYQVDKIDNKDLTNINNVRAIVYIDNPNNPTGSVLDDIEIQNLCLKNPSSIFIIDEAYYEFSNIISAINLIPDMNNLIITRTMSKAFGLASIRSGFLFSNKKLLKLLEATHNKKSVSLFAGAITEVALNNSHIMNEFVNSVTSVKKKFYDILRNHTSINKNHTNFETIFFKDKEKAQKLSSKFGIAFRDMTNTYGIKEALRLTFPDIANSDQFIKLIKIYEEEDLIKKVGFEI